jgi:hypothetical protein
MTLNYYYLRIGYEGTKLKGEFFITYETELLVEEYDAKLQISLGMDGILDIASFKIGGASSDKPGRGTFISAKDGWKEALSMAKSKINDKNSVIFKVKIPKLPNISFWFERSILDWDCPDEDLKIDDIIDVSDYNYIIENPCCRCYSSPYTGMQVTLNGKDCPLSGTSC